MLRKLLLLLVLMATASPVFGQWFVYLPHYGTATYRSNCFFVYYETDNPDLYGVNMNDLRDLWEDRFYCTSERYTDLWPVCDPDRVIEKYTYLGEGELDIPLVRNVIGSQSGVNVSPNWRYRTPFPEDPGIDSQSPWTTPNDSLLARQWNLREQEMNYGWTSCFRKDKGREIVIAIFDTGNQIRHPDFRDGADHNFWINPGEDLNGDGLWTESDFDGIDNDGTGKADDGMGWNFVDNMWDPSQDDWDFAYHGTCVSGIVGARTDNQIGTASYGFNFLKLLSIRAGEFWYLDLEWIVPGMLYVNRLKQEYGIPHVMNMSWGGYYDPLLAWLIECCDDNGIFLVASSGNEGATEPKYPASDERVVSVAATDTSDHLAPFSNSGDFAAPGVSIWTTGAYWNYYNLSWEWYPISGTSAAAPQVAALAGLLKAIAPDSSNAWVLRRMINTTKPLNTEWIDPDDIRWVRYGIIDGRAALNIPEAHYWGEEEDEAWP
ncbi:MAG: Serine protease, subtilase family protein [uncultured bacterium]|nr:MAG: Serine protease, subtilase family protein [uncultured bacterium]